MSNTNEEESLFSELGKFEELQSPFHLFPVLHRELEGLNRLKRNILGMIHRTRKKLLI